MTFDLDFWVKVVTFDLDLDPKVNVTQILKHKTQNLKLQILNSKISKKKHCG